MVTRYGADPQLIRTRRLGVELPKQRAAKGAPNLLRVLSVSSCIQIKRIDRIIDALGLAAQRQTGLRVHWTHIGDGPLRRALEARAAATLPPAAVDFAFLGQLPSSGVHAFLAHTRIDLFVNSSESEGIPVSIMEAMSYGIPVVAPDVGGIAELVTSESGFLISGRAEPREIAAAMCHSREHLSRLGTAARTFIEQHYNASETYPSFVAEVLGWA
jgi:colanic acid/amylovoran biosynthesis glycosyltransferase